MPGTSGGVSILRSEWALREQIFFEQIPGERFSRERNTMERISGEPIYRK
jgi:hypothetical protein